MNKIEIRRPNDFHVHLRNGEMLKNVLPFTSEIFGYAVIMGNTKPPIVTASNVIEYRNEIVSQARDGFKPIMTVMLVNSMTPQILEKAYGAGAKVLKYIPGGTSTASNEGVAIKDLERYYPVLETAQKLGMIFSGHWELITDVDGKKIPEKHREERAMPALQKILKDFPNLKIVVEHVTTGNLINLVESASNVAATITLHHMVIEYLYVFPHKGEMNPLFYCKPVAKGPKERRLLISKATSNNPKFFFGSDSAPHLISKKTSKFPAAGIFSTPVVIPYLWQLFVEKCGLSEETKIKFENFVSCFGAEFYGLPLNEDVVTIKKNKWRIPQSYKKVPVFMGGKELEWQIT